MSCGSSSGGGDDADEQKPTITLNKPADITTGNNILVSFSAKDNVELKSYRVEIAISGTKSTKSVGEFLFDSLSNTQDADGNVLPSISGTSADISFSVATTLPNNKVAVQGTYKVKVTVVDASDNTEVKDVEFLIN
ncbi:hypothetical protein BZG02_12130 [Labilibaculum filiforme]|uniref:DUF4625 domain-containing protein n=2 Tax=Labilibaculum filiforme TaxID=1940526 RepID=A0A2N3HWL9_9BACT|nr:hypothetical protein BZG02_12130 [Labilibaculum filiforme]